MERKRVNFDGGIVRFFAPGAENCKLAIPFAYKTIGSRRYADHYSTGHKASEMISIPMNRNTIDVYDTVVLREHKYRILQFQHIKDTLPATTVITLERYDDDD